jgi:hypothetical protein
MPSFVAAAPQRKLGGDDDRALASSVFFFDSSSDDGERSVSSQTTIRASNVVTPDSSIIRMSNDETARSGNSGNSGSGGNDRPRPIPRQLLRENEELTLQLQLLRLQDEHQQEQLRQRDEEIALAQEQLRLRDEELRLRDEELQNLRDQAEQLRDQVEQLRLRDERNDLEGRIRHLHQSLSADANEANRADIVEEIQDLQGKLEQVEARIRPVIVEPSGNPDYVSSTDSSQERSTVDSSLSPGRSTVVSSLEGDRYVDSESDLHASPGAAAATATTIGPSDAGTAETTIGGPSGVDRDDT